MGHLVLTRHAGQRVRLRTPDGTTIWVQVVEAQGNKVRVSFSAPASTEILREEVIGRVKKEEERG